MQGEADFSNGRMRRGAAVAARWRPGAVLIGLFVALNAALAALLIWQIVVPLGPLGDWQPRGLRAMPLAARAQLLASVDPFTRGAPLAGADRGPAQVTSLALVLFATRALPGGGGSAIIAGADGVQQVYRTGQEVAPGVMLAGVSFDHVLLSRGGAEETLYIDQTKRAADAAAVVAANPVAVPGGVTPGPQAPPGPAPGGLTAEAAQRGIGFRLGGDGVTVSSQGDGSAFRAAGFRAGDVITAVGGKPVSGAGGAAALSEAIRPGSAVSVTVRRGGQSLPMVIDLAPNGAGKEGKAP